LVARALLVSFVAFPCLRGRWVIPKNTVRNVSRSIGASISIGNIWSGSIPILGPYLWRGVFARSRALTIADAENLKRLRKGFPELVAHLKGEET